MKRELLHLVRETSELLKVLAERGLVPLPEPLEPEPQQAASEPVAVPEPVGPAVALPAPRTLLELAPSDPALQESKETRLSFIETQAKACRACRLASTRRNVVFGEGSCGARVLLVGEGPGADEDRSGRPFVGRSGQLLTRMLQAVGLARENVYIANIVKCRPPNNQDPEPDEMASCRAFLDAQIETINPDVIVSLGRVSAQSLLNERSALTALRSRVHKLGRRDLLVTYHPAFLLRNAVKKREAWSDLLMLADLLVQRGIARASSAPWWKA